MKVLASRITKELKKAKHCAVYEPDLTRVWPEEKKREAAIAVFAKENGWRLRYYNHGFCAIFDKKPSPKTKRIARESVGSAHDASSARLARSPKNG